MNALVGFTGFVGSNLYACGKFDQAFNSKNIEDAYGTSPDLLIYAGVRAEKYLANDNPSKDVAQILDAENNIKKIHPKKLVLISTVDVFKSPVGVDENSAIETDGLHAYGYNRHQLELWVRGNYPDALIIRLPALFGANIKKNFLYDYMNVIPTMLKDSKFDELAQKEPILKAYYEPLGNGFYKVDVPDDKRDSLKEVFGRLGFSALHFTDSRSRFQFYNLRCLWNDIQEALASDLKLCHLVTEPVSAGDLYEYLSGKKYTNIKNRKPADYDCRTVYGKIFNGGNGYIDTAENVMKQIKQFVMAAERRNG